MGFGFAPAQGVGVRANRTITAGTGLTGGGSLAADRTLSLDTSYIPQVNDFRLTLTTATPVMTADVSSATTIYLTPYIGNRIALYNGSQWIILASAEVSLALGTLTANLPYDVFAYNNSGTLTLELLAWTNDTTRATALVRQDGVWSKTGAVTRRYVGTIRTISTTATAFVLRPAAGTTPKFFVFNADNQVEFALRAIEDADSWVYTTATLRSANADTTNRIEILQGLSERPVVVEVRAPFNSDVGTINATPGVGVDSTSVQSAEMFEGYSAAAGHIYWGYARYAQPPGVGYHFFQWLEMSTAAGNTTWYGDGGGAARQAGIFARAWG